MLKSSALISARMTAAVYGLDEGLEFTSGHELDQASTNQIPEDMIGRFLDDRGLRRLRRMLLRKKPPAPSVRRLSAQRRRALQVLAGSRQPGASATIMLALGFSPAMLASMVRDGLVMEEIDRVRAGNRMIEVRRFRITEAGRDALGAER